MFTCECGGRLLLREWGSYADETPISDDGEVSYEDMTMKSTERDGWAIECCECGLELTSSFDLVDGHLVRR